MGSDPTGAFGAIRRRPWVSLLCLLMFVSASLLVVLRSNIGFFLDDWDLVIYRSGATDWLLPHNEHIIVLPAAIYEISLSVFGMTAMPIHLLGVAAFELSVLLLFLWMRPLVGEPVSVLGCAVVLFLGASTADLVWAFQIGYSGSIAAGLGALLLLRRDKTGYDVGACALLVISLLFSSMVIPFAIAAAVQLAYRNSTAPDPKAMLRASWVFLVPAALFVIWWLGWGHLAESNLSAANALKIPPFVLAALGYAGAVLTGPFPLREVTTSFVWAIPGLLMAVGFVWCLRRRRKVPPEFLMAAAAAVAFWALTCLNFSPGRDFVASRYQYPSLVLLLMMLAGLFAGLRPGRELLRGLAALTVVSVAVNAAALIYVFDDTYKRFEEQNLSGMTALDISRRTVDPDFSVGIGTDNSGAQVDARSYFAAVDRYGSPGWNQAELDAAPEAERERVDQELFSALPVSRLSGNRLVPVPGTCRNVASEPDGSVPLELESGLVRIGSAQTNIIRFGRFSSGTPIIGWAAMKNEPVGFHLPEDESDVPWRVSFQGEGVVTICRASPARS